MRNFEKVSFSEFKKSISNDKVLYNNYNLPVRKTSGSVGYDFELLEDIEILPDKIVKIPTGVKSNFSKNEMLLIVVRGSLGFKHNIRLTNQLGIVDSDYYNNNTNEGHIFVSLQNEGKKVFKLKKGDRFVQGIFLNVNFIDNEKDEFMQRTGGFGSTNK